MDAAGDNSIRKLHLMVPPGGGKTTLIEGLIQWRVVMSPSNILLVGQKDETAKLWAETRLHPSFERSAAMRPFMPTNRHDKRKTTVIFPHGIYLDICGPAMTNLQEKSMPWVIIEEAWSLNQYPGRMKEAEARTHDKWNSKVFYIGQGGDSHHEGNEDEETDLYREWEKTDKREFHFQCPKCDAIQPYKWQQLKWDKKLDGDGSIDWTETEKTVRYECANDACREEFADTPSIRRKLSSTGRYIPTNPKAIKGHVGFHCNVLAVWRIPWVKAVMEWEDAQEARSRGDFSLLQIFIQKRLAEFWKPTAYDPPAELVPGGYGTGDFANGELIDNEFIRFLTADVQRDHFWFVIRAWTASGDSKQLWCGKVETAAELEEIRKRYQVKPTCTFLDAQYQTDYVYKLCARYGWLSYHGSSQGKFPVRQKSGTTIFCPYSEFRPVRSSDGGKSMTISFSVNPIKDVLADLRAGRLGEWLFADDAIPEFRQHMDSERKVAIQSGRENKIVNVWQRIGKRDNHLLDAEMAQTGLAMIKGLIQPKDTGL